MRRPRASSALEKGVSTRAFVPTFLRQLEALGKSVNLEVASVRPKVDAPQPVQTDEKGKRKKTPVEPYTKLNLDIEVNGKYRDVVRFLNQVTSFPKIVAIHDVQLAPTSQMKMGSLASPVLNVKLNATAFILKEDVRPAKSTPASEATKPGSDAI
jgi:Tfp pilus assembly protein PilO